MRPPDRRQIRAMLAMSAHPSVWPAMTVRHWARLAELMLDAIPDDEAARAEVRRAHPGWTDQADAAADEAMALHDELVVPGVDRVSLNVDHAAEMAMRGQVLRVMAGLVGELLDTCPHVSVSCPRPMFAASWTRQVDCLACFRVSEQPDPSPEEARTCDLCGRLGREPTTLATPTIGILTIGMGVCARCVHRLSLLAPPGGRHAD